MGAAAKHTSETLIRGAVLLCVFYGHALYNVLPMIPDGQSDAMTWAQLKFLAPNVSLFFVLSGMSASRIGNKRPAAIAATTVMLLMLATISHLVGLVLTGPFWIKTENFFDHAIAPIFLGTGYSTFVPWYFIVLAAIRIFAYLWQTRFWLFLVVAGACAGIAAASPYLGLPDNIFEWRNYPAAFFFFMVGAYAARLKKAPLWLALLGLAVSVACSAINAPDLLTRGICLGCNPTFIAQPMIGQYGFAPLFLLQICAMFAFALWLAPVGARTPLAAPVAHFGRHSIEYLMLHGFVLVTLYPLAVWYLSLRESVWVFAAIFAAMVAVHAALFFVLKRPLELTTAFCARWGRIIGLRLFPLPSGANAAALSAREATGL